MVDGLLTSKCYFKEIQNVNMRGSLAGVNKRASSGVSRHCTNKNLI